MAGGMRRQGSKGKGISRDSGGEQDEEKSKKRGDIESQLDPKTRERMMKRQASLQIRKSRIAVLDDLPSTPRGKRWKFGPWKKSTKESGSKGLFRPDNKNGLAPPSDSNNWKSDGESTPKQSPLNQVRSTLSEPDDNDAESMSQVSFDGTASEQRPPRTADVDLRRTEGKFSHRFGTVAFKLRLFWIFHWLGLATVIGLFILYMFYGMTGPETTAREYAPEIARASAAVVDHTLGELEDVIEVFVAQIKQHPESSLLTDVHFAESMAIRLSKNSRRWHGGDVFASFIGYTDSDDQVVGVRATKGAEKGELVTTSVYLDSKGDKRNISKASVLDGALKSVDSRDSIDVSQRSLERVDTLEYSEGTSSGGYRLSATIAAGDKTLLTIVAEIPTESLSRVLDQGDPDVIATYILDMNSSAVLTQSSRAGGLNVAVRDLGIGAVKNAGVDLGVVTASDENVFVAASGSEQNYSYYIISVADISYTISEPQSLIVLGAIAYLSCVFGVMLCMVYLLYSVTKPFRFGLEIQEYESQLPANRVLAILSAMVEQLGPFMPRLLVSQLEETITTFGPSMFSLELNDHSPGVDAETQGWLTGVIQAHNSNIHSRRSSRSADPGDIELLESSRRQTHHDATKGHLFNVGVGVDKKTKGRMMKVMQTLNTWNFDIFEFADLCNSKPLFPLVYNIIRQFDIIENLNLDDTRLRRFLNAIEDSYVSENPYHNSVHGADVTHAMFWMLTRRGIYKWLSDMDVLISIISACIHDVHHDGLNNAFHVKTHDQLATLYNDKSVLENHHLTTAFNILKQDSCNFLHRCSQEQFKEFRSEVIELVTYTDVSLHFEIVGKFRALTAGAPIDMEAPDNRRHLIRMLMKCADVSNPTKHKKIYDSWTDRVMEEFYRQGDRERSMGMEISAFMDRTNPTVAKCQRGFIDFIVMPLYEVVSNTHIIPDLETYPLATLKLNRQRWEGVE
eukprot:GFYU01001873.1.p1 GENE.GFYU01001873.1~~GFYU01001873.1.p1  ORF type:complete len:963 (-),score=196.79 GFYU01001873.1:144-3032(-)